MFDFRLSAPKEGDYPFVPFNHIILKSHSTDGDGKLRLSAQLMTDQEINYRIQLLKDDLDRVGRAAKRALQHSHPNNRVNHS